MKVLVTGADGFIGKNLQLHLEEKKGFEVVAVMETPNSTMSPYKACLPLSKMNKY